jgi:PadR family transcriptional regulator, regulatory protein PadR
LRTTGQSVLRLFDKNLESVKGRLLGSQSPGSGAVLNKDLDKAWRERLVKNHLDLIILRLLKSKPRWGYEVNLEIRDRFKVYLSAGTLYPLLHSMEEKGYLQAVWEAEGGRGRKVYRITSRGEEFLTAGARAAEEFLRRIQYEAELVGPFQQKHA